MKVAALHAYMSMSEKFPNLRWAALMVVNGSPRPVTQGDVDEVIAELRGKSGYSSVRSRLPELERMGCIQMIGHRTVKWKNTTQMHTTYGMTPRGVQVLELPPKKAIKVLANAMGEMNRIQDDYNDAIKSIYADYENRKINRSRFVIDQALSGVGGSV